MTRYPCLTPTICGVAYHRDPSNCRGSRSSTPDWAMFTPSALRARYIEERADQSSPKIVSENGVISCDDGPAVTLGIDGNITVTIWAKDDKLHREDGPAMTIEMPSDTSLMPSEAVEIIADSVPRSQLPKNIENVFKGQGFSDEEGVTKIELWARNGMLHRDPNEGPAVSYEWEGAIRSTGHVEEVIYNARLYYKNGLQHRTNGPASENDYDGSEYGYTGYSVFGVELGQLPAFSEDYDVPDEEFSDAINYLMNLYPKSDPDLVTALAVMDVDSSDMESAIEEVGSPSWDTLVRLIGFRKYGDATVDPVAYLKLIDSGVPHEWAYEASRLK